MCRARLLVILLVAAYPGLAAGGVKDDIGYTRLAAELGAELPTGAGVRVAQVEANVDRRLGADGKPLDGRLDFLPISTNPQFSGKKFHKLSAAGGDASSHANAVGNYFYGLNDSIAPGITDVDTYSADGWLSSDYLSGREGFLPALTSARVFNHSWVDQGSAAELARIDYAVDQYDVLHVAGVNNVSNGGAMPVMASAYNAITVGLTSGRHETSNAEPRSRAGLALYSSNTFLRARPDLVVPHSFTSYATPYVAGAGAMLVGFAHAHPELSNGSVALPGYTVQHAETSEVIRSALMAGASRSNWADYRAAEYKTLSGVDFRYGAGQLDVYESYRILAGGEHDSREAGNPGLLGPYGFDYQSEFFAGDTATYRFAVGADLESLAASLVWNAAVGIDQLGTTVNYAAELANFNLTLFEESAGGAKQIDFSLGLADNTANLWLPELAPGNYTLQVTRIDALGAWDYGLAWRRNVVALGGDANRDGAVDLNDFLVIRTNFGKAGGRAEGDFNGDGRVDLADFLALKGNYGRQLSSRPAGSPVLTAVPEPATGLLAGGGLVAMALVGLTRRRRRGQQPATRATAPGDARSAGRWSLLERPGMG